MRPLGMEGVDAPAAGSADVLSEALGGRCSMLEELRHRDFPMETARVGLPSYCSEHRTPQGQSWRPFGSQVTSYPTEGQKEEKEANSTRAR